MAVSSAPPVAGPPSSPGPVHDLPVHEAVVLMRSDLDRGLTADEVARRLARFGPNVLPRTRGPGTLARLAQQFRHPLIYILLASAAVMLAVGEPVDAGVIAGIVLLNAAIGFVQESRAQQALDALAAMVRTTATVVRDGSQLRISSDGLVPGDLVVLATGDAVPADLRLVEVGELRVDESALTGESLASHKAEAVLERQTGVADRSNMAFAGTLVAHGDGRGIAIATGGQTEIGLIHRLMSEATAVDTPLTRKIAHFSAVLLRVILVLAAATYLVGLARGEDAADMLVAAVALAVAAVPEGLPAAVTITLAIGVGRMARRRAVVRRLPAVETLGSTTVICSDKTGTLTENQMTVQAVVAGGERFTVTGAGYATAGELLPAGRAARSAPLRECLVAGALCNDARVDTRPDGQVAIVGDPTEAALIVAARKAGLDVDGLAADQPRIATIQFQSELRYMATLHERSGGASPVAYVKGAVERVLPMCSTALGDDGPLALDRPAVLELAHELGAAGLRVLAFARDTAPDVARFRSGEAGEGLQFLGLQAMIDPPRPEAIRAVATCHKAGIAVKMITGDHVATARAIAERVGLGAPVDGREPVAAMTGSDIAACSDSELAEAAARTTVFARVAPDQKLRLVEALQGRGETVAMTGDGVNDAPALKRADIGVAMGRSGTEVARDAADVVLTDDDFASIEAAVDEGRRTFDNLTKFVVWTLPTNMGEGLVVLAAIAIGATLPILPVQILWINMTSAGALGVMLAFERGEAGIMDRPPRRPAQPLLTRELMARVVLVSALLLGGSFAAFEWALGSGMSVAEARTVAVNLFVAGELFYLLNCRSLERSILHVGAFGNRWVIGGIGVTIALQLLFTYSPQMNSLFDSAPIGWDAWARILGFGIALWAIVGAEKWVRRRRTHNYTTE